METLTSASLLEALKNNQDSIAWDRFVTRYRPLILKFAQRLGLDKADAEDIGQETMLAFLQEYREGRYNCQAGRLRNWLFTIARCRVVDLKRKKVWEVVVQDKTQSAGLLTRVESPDEMERVWEQEWQKAVLRACLEEAAKEVTPQTLAIFDLYVGKNWKPEKVALQLGVSVNAVYIAKNRIMSQVRKLRPTMEEIW
jgi:RNA polymerase sigma-70 factor, ECF subfamily